MEIDVSIISNEENRVYISSPDIVDVYIAGADVIKAVVGVKEGWC